VEFTLNPAAKFSDGSPVTVEDVLWSFETLGTEGHGRYRGFWGKVETLEQVGPLAGLRPILKKAQWDGLDFAESGLDVVPITSSEYVIDDYEAGRFISFKRNPDYWGDDIPFRRGTGNLDEIRMEFYGDETAAFESFKVGTTNANREFNVAKWESQYNFPRIDNGEVVQEVLPHSRPSGMTGFAMNTRTELFSDWRVRDAMLHMFNFPFINEAMTGGVQPRITSYWSNSPLAMSDGPATGRVAEFLEPFADELLPGALEGYALPQGDGTERNRAGTTAALAQMEAAGWTVQDGVMKNAEGTPFAFNIVIQSGSSENAAMMDTYYRRGLSLSPGNEQFAYYGSERADDAGGRNLMGVKSAAADAMIERLLTSESQDDFRAAVKALDRVLTTRLAQVRELKHPEYIPIFGDWPGWQPDVWWWQE